MTNPPYKTKGRWGAPLQTLDDLRMYPLEKEDTASLSPFKTQQQRILQAMKDGRLFVSAPCGDRDEPPVTRVTSLEVSSNSEITEAVMDALALPTKDIFDNNDRHHRVCTYKCKKDHKGKGPFLVETKCYLMSFKDNGEESLGRMMHLTVSYVE